MLWPCDPFRADDPLYLEPVPFWVGFKAVREWHYSRTCTTAMACYGVFEVGVFRGAVLFSRGAASEIGSPFGVEQSQIMELVRVALSPDHQNQTSKVVAVALRLLRREHPQLKLVVSFADSAQGHHGGIYQAGGWLYLGSKSYHMIELNGKLEHPKSLHGRFEGKPGQSIPWLRENVDPLARRVVTPPKHKFVMCFDVEVKRRVQAISRPYPKRVASEVL